MWVKNRRIYSGIFMAIILFLVGAGCSSKPEDRYGKEMVQPDQVKKDSVEIHSSQEDDKMVKDRNVDMMISEMKGSYEPYGAEKIALAEKGKVVLFFHAPWCPNCRTIDADIFKSTVPDGVTILKVDYDSSTDLKKKYGVTTQHTFVQVDKQGLVIKKWSGGSTLDDVVKQIQ